MVRGVERSSGSDRDQGQLKDGELMLDIPAPNVQLLLRGTPVTEHAERADDERPRSARDWL
jgi:hypothetical protein